MPKVVYIVLLFLAFTAAGREFDQAMCLIQKGIVKTAVVDDARIPDVASTARAIRADAAAPADDPEHLAVADNARNHEGPTVFARFAYLNEAMMSILKPKIKMKSVTVGFWLRCVLGVLAVLAVAFIVTSLFLGRIIKAAIVNFDKSFFGVEIDIGNISVSIIDGRIEIEECIVKSPEGFQADYVLNVGKAVVDLKMGKLLTSRMKVIEIEELTTVNVDAIVEYKGVLGGQSNIQEILDNMQKSEAATKASKHDKEDCDTPAPPKKEEQEDTKTDAGAQIILHAVAIENVGMKLQTKLLGARISAGDIKYPDFAAQSTAEDVVSVTYLVMKSIFKTLLANVTGKGFADRFL